MGVLCRCEGECKKRESSLFLMLLHLLIVTCYYLLAKRGSYLRQTRNRMECEEFVPLGYCRSIIPTSSKDVGTMYPQCNFK